MIDHRLLREAVRLIIESSGTDSVEDVTFDGPDYEGGGTDYVSISAAHPRLGNVGGVSVMPVSSDKPLDPEFAVETQPWDILTPTAWADFDSMRKRLRKPDLKVYMVNSSSVHRIFRGEGLGQALYSRLLRWLADNENAVLVPNSAVEGEAATSQSARRVWGALSRTPGITMVGDVAWGGNIAVREPASRRGHGFLKTSRPRNRNHGEE